MVARFDLWQKDHKSLVLTMLKLDSNFRLYFAGIGPNQNNMKLLVKDLGLEDRIYFLGLRDDIFSLMKKVDLNILITRFEGLSGVVLESLAANKPFLGSNVSGVFDIVPDSRFLLLSNEPELISSKIYSLYNSKDMQNSMCKDGFDFVQNYDTQIMVDKLVSFYNHILKNSNESKKLSR
jgi:glycosyltransferase involved in cell wall biosynthesis